jgi:hypothetical protein
MVSCSIAGCFTVTICLIVVSVFKISQTDVLQSVSINNYDLTSGTVNFFFSKFTFSETYKILNDIQWAPLNRITDNGTNQIIESRLCTFTQSHQLENWLFHWKKEYG